jgi:hypothetical protein
MRDTTKQLSQWFEVAAKGLEGLDDLTKSKSQRLAKLHERRRKVDILEDLLTGKARLSGSRRIK